MTRTLSIAIKENTYRELKNKIRIGKISSFINKLIEKELFELEKEQRREREKLEQRLIEGYKMRSKNKKLQKMLYDYSEMSLEDISTELTKREKNVKAKK